PDLDAVDDALWRNILGVNLFGPWYVSRAAVPELRERHGAIVNVSSVAGIVAGGSSLPYAVSKAALNHLTRTLARALAPAVHVNQRSVLLDEGDLAGRLEDGPLHLVEPLDLLAPRLLHHVVERQPLGAQVALDRLSVLHDDQRSPLDHLLRETRLEDEERRSH